MEIVVPCWNESPSIRPMVELLAHVQEEMSIPLRVTFVDDGSTDGTWDSISEVVASLSHTDSSNLGIRGIRLSGRAGKAAAQAVGLRHSTNAEAVIVMDGDGQHPVSSIPDMVTILHDQNSVVIGSRVGYSRTLISGIGTRGLRFIMRGLGIPFDPSLSEFLVIPGSVADELARSPRLGVVPIVPLLQSISDNYLQYPVEIRPRIATGEKTRWTFTDLWRKALLQVLADPWKLLPRITLLAVVSFVVLFAASLLAAVHAVVQGTSPGTVAILGSVVVLAAISVAMWVSSIVIGVMSLRLIENLGRSGPEVVILDAPVALD